MSNDSKPSEQAASLPRLVMPDKRERNELDGINCPQCDHPVSEPVNDIWKDPSVKARLKEGRPANDIAVLACPQCGRWGYYNLGSTFWCRFCEVNFECLSEGEEPHPDGHPHIWLDGFTTLEDTITDTTDGYENETRPAVGHNNERRGGSEPSSAATG